MKWLTHQTAAVASAVALHLPPAAVLAVWAGAILPDLADQRISRLAPTKGGRQKIFNAIHRGTSHWLGWWMAIFLAGMSGSLPEEYGILLAGLGFGAINHVLLDMLTPQGIPLRPFSRKNRFSLKLCSTGSLGEYCLLAVIALACCFFLGQDFQQLAFRAGNGDFFSVVPK